MFLQPLPGEDVTVLAGLLRLIFKHGWQDRDFCARHVRGIGALERAVAGFTPDYVRARAGVAADELLRRRDVVCTAAARTVRKRGSAASGTGPDMGPHSNLAEHLVECLNVVCGRYAREGDPVPNPGVLGAACHARHM